MKILSVSKVIHGGASMAELGQAKRLIKWKCCSICV